MLVGTNINIYFKKALAIAQSAVIFTGTIHGLGKLQSEMSAAHFTTVEKVTRTQSTFLLKGH